MVKLKYALSGLVLCSMIAISLDASAIPYCYPDPVACPNGDHMSCIQLWSGDGDGIPYCRSALNSNVDSNEFQVSAHDKQTGWNYFYFCGLSADDLKALETNGLNAEAQGHCKSGAAKLKKITSFKYSCSLDTNPHGVPVYEAEITGTFRCEVDSSLANSCQENCYQSACYGDCENQWGCSIINRDCNECLRKCN